MDHNQTPESAIGVEYPQKSRRRRSSSREKAREKAVKEWFPAFALGFCTACLFVILTGVVVFKMNPQPRSASADRASAPAATDRSLASESGLRNEDAGTFLISRLDPIFDFTSGQRTLLWQVYDTSFGDIWTWCEKSVAPHYPDASGPLQTICYDLDPADLDVRSAIDPMILQGEQLWALRLECQKTDCISFYPPIDISRADQPSQFESDTQSHVWYYTSRQNAERSATALTQLLFAAGATKGPY